MTNERKLGRAMSMRARVVLIGLLAIGKAEALATAPQIVDPREDVFGSESRAVTGTSNDALLQRPDRSPPPSSEQAGVAKLKPGPAQLPTASGAKPELPANPLWSIPLSRLTATRDRPPFSASRRPPQAITAIKPVAPAAPPPKPPEPVKPQLSLVGTVVGAGRGIGLFVNAADKSTIRLKAGENHQGWILRAVGSRQVELVNGLDSAVLKLALPDMKPVAGALPAPSPVASAPGTPLPAFPVATPQGMPLRSFPVNASQQGNMALPKDGSPPGAAKTAFQPPVFDPPAPVANPFADALSRRKGATQ